MSKWFTDYSSSMAKKPWYFFVMNRSIQPGEEITVIAYPDVEARIKLGTEKPPEPCELQVPLFIINEVIAEDDAQELRSALGLIQDGSGLDETESILLLVHACCLLEDWRKHCSNEQPLFLRPRYQDLVPPFRDNDSLVMEFMSRQPVTSVRALLSLWQLAGEHLIKGVATAPDCLPGLPSYAYYPPHWLSLEDLKRREGGDGTTAQVPVLMDATLAPYAKNMIDFLKLGRAFRPDVPTTSPGDAASEPVFTYSPDFRSVCLRGVQCSLTSQQAQVIECLWTAHTNNTPEISQQYITCTLLDLNQDRLRDVFKGNRDAYRILILPGKRRGTFRLAI
jgi:hypothetical protein